MFGVSALCPWRCVRVGQGYEALGRITSLGFWFLGGGSSSLTLNILASNGDDKIPPRP